MPSKHHEEGLYRSHHHRKQLFIRDLGVSCGQSKSLNVKSFHKRPEDFGHKKYHTAPCVNMSNTSLICHNNMSHKGSHTSHHNHHGGHSHHGLHRGDSHHSHHGGHSHHGLHRGDSHHSHHRGDSHHSLHRGDSHHSHHGGDSHHSLHRGDSYQSHHRGGGHSHHSIHRGHSQHSHHRGHSQHSHHRGHSQHSHHRGLCCPGCPPPPIPPAPPIPPGCPPVSRYGRPQQAAICIVDDDYKVEPVADGKITHHTSHHSNDSHKWLQCSLDWAENTIHEANRGIITGPKKQIGTHKQEAPHCSKDKPKPFCQPCHPPEPVRVRNDDDRNNIDCRKGGPEIRGGKFISGCICHKRNGLQDDCPLTICQGKGCNHSPCSKIRPRTFCEPPYATDITTEEDQKRRRNLVKCGCKEFISKKPKEHYHRAGYPCPICDATPDPQVEKSTWRPEKTMCIYKDKPTH